jgi:hypothetical protein
MRRYKIVAILLILSVISFVLAAPVAVQVREACADAMDGGENVIIGSKKRAGEGDSDPLIPQAQRGPSSSSPLWSSPWWLSLSGESKPPLLSTSGATKVPWNPLAEGEAKLIQSQDQGSSSAPNSASGTHSNPSVSSGESKPLLSTSGGTEVPWNSLAEGEANLNQPGTSTGIQPASSSNAKSVSWDPSKKVILPQQSPQFKEIVSKVVGKLKFWRRIFGTAGGVVTEG